MTGEAIGPIIGEAYSGFLSILGMIVLAALIIFLPETQRSIAGNGSIPLSGFHKPFVYPPRAPMVWTEDREKKKPFPETSQNDILEKGIQSLSLHL
ncbi:major facilitator superfamily domain-containing protein [Penicillium canescens]|uniref:Major facilitator superfamily domain-containing protein n=1 Tax=Penicillium canescens TaxID=5083 RepID=A0AAD6I9Z3_PENCN|nr:major facilitator superfamily domain-containing protein [Penicillium canescens]KAJ6038573.1 major facilitator superfamily domain-containing protein [Penicillium canescens]KAJ6068339.1 major facilitator superfamily domain-containing protein [Penicillium canescens]